MKYSELKVGDIFCFENKGHPRLRFVGGFVTMESGIANLYSNAAILANDPDVQLLDFADVTALRAELADAYAGLDAIHEVAMQYQERHKRDDEIEQATSAARDRRKGD